MRRKSRRASSAKGKAKKTDFFKKNSVQALFYLNAILWFLYAFYIVIDMSVVRNNFFSVTIVGIFILVNAGAMLASGILIVKPQKWVYYFSFAVTVLNILLALTNLTDYFYAIAFILDLFILWILFVLRKSYLTGS